MEKEQVCEFYNRLMVIAKTLKITEEAFLTPLFLNGLKSRDVKKEILRTSLLAENTDDNKKVKLNELVELGIQFERELKVDFDKDMVDKTI